MKKYHRISIIETYLKNSERKTKKAKKHLKMILNDGGIIMRIYEFAREHGYNSSKILSILEGLGYSNRTVMGSLTEDMKVKLMDYLNEDGERGDYVENDSV